MFQQDTKSLGTWQWKFYLSKLVDNMWLSANYKTSPRTRSHGSIGLGMGSASYQLSHLSLTTGDMTCGVDYNCIWQPHLNHDEDAPLALYDYHSIAHNGLLEAYPVARPHHGDFFTWSIAQIRLSIGLAVGLLYALELQVSF